MLDLFRCLGNQSCATFERYGEVVATFHALTVHLIHSICQEQHIDYGSALGIYRHGNTTVVSRFSDNCHC